MSGRSARRSFKGFNVSDNKFHQIRLQLSSEQLIELFTWLHDNKAKEHEQSGRAMTSSHPAEILRATVLAHMLANLDACKKPYVAVGDDLILPVTEDRLEVMAFGGDFSMGTAKSNPSDHFKDQSIPSYEKHNFSDPVLDAEPDAREDAEVKWEEEPKKSN